MIVPNSITVANSMTTGIPSLRRTLSMEGKKHDFRAEDNEQSEKYMMYWEILHMGKVIQHQNFFSKIVILFVKLR